MLQSLLFTLLVILLQYLCVSFESDTGHAKKMILTNNHLHL